jgi:hypothetical protein
MYGVRYTMHNTPWQRVQEEAAVCTVSARIVTQPGIPAGEADLFGLKHRQCVKSLSPSRWSTSAYVVTKLCISA